MSAIRYDIIPGEYYSTERGRMTHLHGFPDGVLAVEGDTELQAFVEKNQAKYPWDCEKTGKFYYNGITHYASAKTLKMVEKKFKIGEVFTDKDLKKEREAQEEKLRKLKLTDEWLQNKVLDDSVGKFGLYKQYQFVQQIRDENKDISHSRMTKVTQKFLKEDVWKANVNGYIISGPNFPKEKIPKQVVEKKSLYGRRRRKRT